MTTHEYKSTGKNTFALFINNKEVKGLTLTELKDKKRYGTFLYTRMCFKGHDLVWSSYCKRDTPTYNIEVARYLLRLKYRPALAFYYQSLRSEQRTYEVDYVKRRKQLTQMDAVKFDCNFKPNGCCKNRSHYDKDDPDFGKNCCAGCHLSMGYFRDMDVDPQAIPFLAKNFDFELGFWRKGQGCIIPRKWRSNVCVGHNCGFKDEISRSLHKVLMKMPYKPKSLADALKEKYGHPSYVKTSSGKLYRFLGASDTEIYLQALTGNQIFMTVAISEASRFICADI